MASQSDVSAALQRAGVTVYGLQVSGDTITGTVASEDARQKVYSAISGVDSAANFNISIDPGFAAQEASAAATGGSSYTIKSGDSLSKIAKEHYGDASQWKKIYEANRDKISDPDRIQAGAQITIPA